ncbi:UNVERIFIED_CONTAM: hypothetical protein K2H54_057115 [Gekko kuhli]
MSLATCSRDTVDSPPLPMRRDVSLCFSLAPLCFGFYTVYHYHTGIAGTAMLWTRFSLLGLQTMASPVGHPNMDECVPLSSGDQLHHFTLEKTLGAITKLKGTELGMADELKK